MNEKKSDIEKILEERLKLDKVLQSEFSKQVTVMFTDIKGSTSFYERRGDIAGRVMVHRHNSIVLPAIKDNKGTLLKTIGDATMSLFHDPADAVMSAQQIQVKLREDNEGKPEKEQIHVRVGLNYGTGLVEDNDVYGDVVNVASRVESLADADQILITGDLYKKVRNNDEFIFRYVETTKVKGKKEPFKVYRIRAHSSYSIVVAAGAADQGQSITMWETFDAGDSWNVYGQDWLAGRTAEDPPGFVLVSEYFPPAVGAGTPAAAGCSFTSVGADFNLSASTIFILAF